MTPESKSFRGVFKFLAFSTIAFVCVIGLIVSVVAYVLLSTPRPTNIRGCFTTEMFQVNLCPKGPNYVRSKDISTNIKNAVIVSEDGNFYGHQGIDWFEMRESFNTNWERGSFARGGSTITQQLAKNLYLSSEKSLLRKVREAIIALQIETILSKDEILEKYLNVVEFGPNLYGIGPASRFYFGKSASQLTAAESAFLAFLLPNPKKYSVSFRKKLLTPFARGRLKEIVSRLGRYHKISGDDLTTALYQVDHFYGGAEITSPQPESDMPSAEEQDESSDTDKPAAIESNDGSGAQSGADEP
jgi:monofunctional biosynthetic peptidoglycan transglycosylase